MLTEVGIFSKDGKHVKYSSEKYSVILTSLTSKIIIRFVMRIKKMLKG